MAVRRVGPLLAVAAVLLAGGCSSASSTPTAPSAAPSTAPVPSASPSPSVGCPDGTYLVTALEGQGQASAIGKGTGGDIAADFEGGDFSLSSDGAQPVALAIGPVKAELRFDGRIEGTYEGDASALRLATTDAEGEVGVKGFGVSRSGSASALAGKVIGQGATAQVVCDDTAGTAVITLPNAILTLTRR